MGVCQKSLHILTTSESRQLGSLSKALRSVVEVDYGVDGRLFLAVKSLHSCTEICVRVGRIKSRLFTVDVGLRQGRVLSPLLFIVYIRGGQTKARRPVCTFFQAPRCRLWTAVQHSNKCWLSRKSHCIWPSSGQVITNSSLGSKRLATLGRIG